MTKQNVNAVNARFYTLLVTDEDGDEIAMKLPARREVCPVCEGRGTAPRESLRGHVYTEEDFAEDPSLQDFCSDLASGRYDETCTECGGDRVILVPDEEKLTAAQRAAWQAHEKSREEDRKTWLAETRLERFIDGGCRFIDG